MKWEMCVWWANDHKEGDGSLQAILADGWEPFAATMSGASFGYHFRRPRS